MGRRGPSPSGRRGGSLRTGPDRGGAQEMPGAGEEMQGVFATGGKLGEHISLHIRFRPGLPALRFSSLIRTRLGLLLKESRTWVPLGAGARQSAITVVAVCLVLLARSRPVAQTWHLSSLASPFLSVCSRVFFGSSSLLSALLPLFSRQPCPVVNPSCSGSPRGKCLSFACGQLFQGA